MPSSALRNIEQMRLSGRKPSGGVRVWLDWKPWFADGSMDVLIYEDDNILRVDVRPLVGCVVDLFVIALSERSWRAINRISEISPTVLVTISEWLERGEVGFVVENGETREVGVSGGF